VDKTLVANDALYFSPWPPDGYDGVVMLFLIFNGFDNNITLHYTISI